MADAKKSNDETSTPAPKAKSKLLLLIVIGVLILVIGAGVAFFLLKKDHAGDEGKDAAAQAEETKKKIDPATPPVFYRFEKPFTVKLQTEQQEAYLQTEVQLRLLKTSVQELIKQYEPELKHRITLALMEKKASDLGTAAGVQHLANELRDIANQVIAPSTAPVQAPAAPPATATTTTDAASPAAGVTGTPPVATVAPDAPVQSVLFSTFIIQ